MSDRGIRRDGSSIVVGNGPRNSESGGRGFLQPSACSQARRAINSTGRGEYSVKARPSRAYYDPSLDTPVVPILVATGLITTTKCIQLRASSVAKAASAFKGAFLYFYQATMIYMDLKDLFANCAGTDGRQQVFICRPGDEDDLIEIKCQKVDVESCWLSDYVIKGSDSEIRLMKKLYRLWMEESPIMLWRPIYQVLMSTTIITGRADGDQYADDRPGEAEMGKFHADATGSARSTRKRKANPGTDLNERAAKRAKHQSSSTSNGNSNGDSSDSDGSSDSSDDSSSDASSDSEEDVLARMDADLKISLDPLPARSAKSKKKAKSLAYTPRRKPLKPGGNFPCPVAKQTNCKEKFTTSSHSHRHVRNKHPGLSRFTCRYCKATFTTSQQLADHKISQHNMDSVRRPEELPRHQSPDGSTSMDDNDRIALQGENAAGRYIYQSSGRWTQDEHDCLEEALANYKGERTKMYSTIHRLHGPKGTTDTRLRNRTPDQIGDYARTQLGVARLIKAWKWTEEAKHTFKEGYARFCKEKYVWKLIRVAYPDVLGEHDYLDMVDQAKKLGLI